MKLFERRETEESLDRLPEVRPGVEVPDDIRGLEAPTTRKPTAGGVRWMLWVAAIMLLGAAGVVTAVLLRSDESDQTHVQERAGPDRVGGVRTEPSYMELYGTDNPTFAPEATAADTVDTVETVSTEPSYMELYGTDNPTFVEP